MSGPARAGAVVYAKDMASLVAFYRELLRARTLYAGPEHTVLQSPDMQLVIHAIPAHIADTFEIAVPPVPREEQAIKLFFTVPSIAWARTVAAAQGGSVGRQAWEGEGFTAWNATDPEGNILQLREAANADPIGPRLSGEPERKGGA